jgi:hypothetical protein
LKRATKNRPTVTSSSGICSAKWLAQVVGRHTLRQHDVLKTLSITSPHSKIGNFIQSLWNWKFEQRCAQVDLRVGSSGFLEALSLAKICNDHRKRPMKCRLVCCY